MKKDGLPELRIEIEPEYLAVLEKDIWNEERIPSTLIVNHIAYDIGMRYRGNHTRKLSKKSYEVCFDQINEELSAREIHLNAEYCDPSLIRNKLSLDFFKEIGGHSPDSRHVLIEVNGRSEGIYLQLESVGDLYLQKRKLLYGPIYYATNHDTNFSLLTTKGKLKDSLISGYFRKLGNDEDDLDLERLIKNVNTIPRHDFGQEIIKYLDVNNYLIWLCGVVCTQNYDAFIQNYALYKNGETGLYEMIPWDFDSTFGRDWNGRVMKYDRVRIEGFNTLTARLLDVREFRKHYRLQLEELLETLFTSSNMEVKIKHLHNQLRPYITLDPYKEDTLQSFDDEPEFILEFISNRNRYLKEHLKNLT